jgi:hypothetical protein
VLALRLVRGGELLGRALQYMGQRYEYYRVRSCQQPNVTNITICSVDWFILSLTMMMDRRMAKPIESGVRFPVDLMIAYTQTHTLYDM